VSADAKTIHHGSLTGPGPLGDFRNEFHSECLYYLKYCAETGIERIISSPLASKDSRNFARFSCAETGTVFGTASLFDLEP